MHNISPLYENNMYMKMLWTQSEDYFLLFKLFLKALSVVIDFEDRLICSAVQYQGPTPQPMKGTGIKCDARDSYWTTEIPDQYKNGYLLYNVLNAILG